MFPPEFLLRLCPVPGVGAGSSAGALPSRPWGCGQGWKLPGPGGVVQIDRVTQCDAKFSRVARVGKDRQIAIEWTSRGPIPPVAYPATRTPAEWDQFLQKWHLEWGGKWQAPPK